jgi:hypothetical protein
MVGSGQLFVSFAPCCLPQTLSFHVVRDDVLNDRKVTTDPFFAGFYSIEKGTFPFQCSEHTSSNEIEKVFKDAISRQHTTVDRVKRMCVVFLDEAGLPGAHITCAFNMSPPLWCPGWVCSHNPLGSSRHSWFCALCYVARCPQRSQWSL